MDPVIEFTLTLFRNWRIELMLVVMAIVLMMIFILINRLFNRMPADAFPFLGNRLVDFEKRLHQLERTLRDEFTRDRHRNRLCFSVCNKLECGLPNLAYTARSTFQCWCIDRLD